MTNHAKPVVSTTIKRVFRTTASVILIVAMAITMTLSANSFAFAAEETGELWAITIGDEEVLYVDSQESAQQVIEGLKNYYLSEGSTVKEVNFEPEIQIKRVYKTADAEYARLSNQAIDVESAVQLLSEGKVNYYVYKTEEGESLQSIAKERGISAKRLVTLNFGDYDADETIKEGTYLVLYEEVPYLEVTTVEEVTSTKSIDYDIVYKKTTKLKKGTYKVSQKGVKGEKEVVEVITKVNGEETDSELISEAVTKEPEDKIVLKGTTSVNAKRGVTYDFVEGSEIVDYAKKFVGNPYRYGGTSLTNGADCSGFVYAVYKRFGINLPRSGQSTIGKAVSYKNVKKGDILVYYGHYAIYAGNGKAIHAVNERLGIRVTSAYYTGSIIGVRRVVS